MYILIISIVYLIISFWLSRGLYKVEREIPRITYTKDLKIVLLVAARNEEKTLPKLLDSLRNQTLPTQYFDIHVINDRSDDGTVDVLNRYRTQMENLSYSTVVEVPSGVAPKKNAIQLGISETESDIIVITDADCIVKERWLEMIYALFENGRVGLVQGLTGYGNNSSETLLHRFQAIDFFSHSIVAAAGIGVNLPINSNANNFSYRRSLYERLGGYGKMGSVVSGDDDLLLQRVWQDPNWEISYVANSHFAVETEAPQTWSAMFEQRKRWGSKTVYYKPVQVAVLASIFLFYITFLFNIFYALSCWGSWYLVVFLYLVKLIGELLFFVPGTSILGKRELLKDIWWASPVQLFVVIFSVFQGVLGSFSWKGETFSRKVKS